MSGNAIECELVDVKGLCFKFTVNTAQEARRLQLDSAAAYRKLNALKKDGVKPCGKMVGGKLCPLVQGAAASDDLKSPAKKKARKYQKPAPQPQVVDLVDPEPSSSKQIFATSTPLHNDAANPGSSNAAAPKFRKSLQIVYARMDEDEAVKDAAAASSVVPEAASTAAAMTSEVSLHDMQTMFSTSLTLDDSMAAATCERKPELEGKRFNVPSDDSEEEDASLVALKNSSYMSFTKPSAMGLVSFIEMLRRKMQEANFIELDEEFIINCSIVDGIVLVEFNSCEYANLAMLLDNNINFRGSNFQMEMKRFIKPAESVVKPTLVRPTVRHTNVEPTVEKTTAQTTEEHSPQGLNSVLIPKQDEASMIVAENEINISVNEFISLESEEGTVTFLKLLIKHKNLFPQSGSFDNILERMRQVLIRKNIITSLSNLRDHRERLRNNYTKSKRKNKNTCKHFIALDVAFGGSSTSSLEGTQYEFSHNADLELDDEPAPCTSREKPKVASWTTDSAKALIGACRDDQEGYDKPIRHSNFWANIRQTLLEKDGFDYTPQQCEDKVSSLKKTYNDLIGDAGTGAEGIIAKIQNPQFRELMESVHLLIGDSVSVRPEMTVSVGFKSMTKRRSKSPGKKSKKSKLREVMKFAGKKRYLKKNKKSKMPSLAERKVAAFEMRAASLMALASNYQKKKSKDKKKKVIEKKEETSDSDSDSSSNTTSHDSDDDSTE